MIDCPFVAFKPYTSEASAIFSGREYECDVLAQNLISTPLTVLYGPSGVGKSSLLRAGVIPRLQSIAQENRTPAGTVPFVVVFHNTWAGDPLAALEATVRGELGRYGVQADLTASSYSEKLLAWSEKVRILIVLDQFEESFSLANAASGTEFADEFPVTVDAPRIRATHLISIRDDALAGLDRYQAEVPRLLDNIVRLAPMTDQKLKAAMESILQKFGVIRPDALPRHYESGLLDELISQLNARRLGLPIPGWKSAPVEAAYLQLVLKELWEQESAEGSAYLRHATLRKFGNAREVIRSYVDTKMSELGDSQNIAADLLKVLVLPSGAKLHFSAADLQALKSVEGTDVEKIGPVLEQLSALKLLNKVDESDGSARYSLAHDTLHFALRDWRDRRLDEMKEQVKRNTRDDALAEAEKGTRMNAAELAEARRELLTARAESWRSARLSLSSELSAWALYLFDDDPCLSAALTLYSLAATESISAPPREAALDALYRSALRVPDRGTAVLTEESAAGSPDGNLRAAADVGGAVRVFSTAGEVFLEGPRRPVVALVFSRDGKRLAGATAEGEIYLWDHARVRLIFTLRGNPISIRTVGLGVDELKERVRSVCRPLTEQEKAEYLRAEDLSIDPPSPSMNPDNPDAYPELDAAQAAYTDEERQLAGEI